MDRDHEIEKKTKMGKYMSSHTMQQGRAHNANLERIAPSSLPISQTVHRSDGKYYGHHQQQRIYVSGY